MQIPGSAMFDKMGKWDEALAVLGEKNPFGDSVIPGNRVKTKMVESNLRLPCVFAWSDLYQSK